MFRADFELLCSDWLSRLSFHLLVAVLKPFRPWTISAHLGQRHVQIERNGAPSPKNKSGDLYVERMKEERGGGVGLAAFSTEGCWSINTEQLLF